jgi:hypothetical protein
MASASANSLLTAASGWIKYTRVDVETTVSTLRPQGPPVCEIGFIVDSVSDFLLLYEF